MSVRIRRIGDVVLMELEGEITLSGGGMPRALGLQGNRPEDIRGALDGVLRDGHRKIILDLGRVSFLDSAGLGELVACKKRVVERGGDVKLLRPTGRVRDMLELVQLTKVLEIHQDEAQAIRSFA